MRPIKLTLQAFGSYVQETVIDFERLGTSGLYLITGDTGAGKTMIFDGIVYALFEESSGGNRDEELRSKAAPSDMPMKVVLTFAYGGKEYTVTRGVGIQKKRAGFDPKAKFAELKLPDGTIIDKPNAKIVELLGVNAKQFGQIAMLAQGKFRDLIDCETSKRSEILKKIFHTERYAKLQEVLKDLRKDAKDKYKEEERKLDYAIDTMRVPEVLPDSVAGYADLCAVGMSSSKDDRKLRPTYEKALEIVEAVLDEDGKEKARFTTRLAEIAEKLGALGEEIGATQAFEAAEKQLKICEEQAPRLAQEESRCQARLQEAEKRLPESKEAQDKAAALREQLEQHEILSKSLAECEQIQKQCVDLEQAKTKAERAICETQDELDRLRKDKEELSGCAVEAEKLRGDLDRCEKIGSCVTSALQKLEKVKEAQANLTATKANYDKIAQEAECATHAFDVKYSAFLNDQAGILAAKLQDGHPCPVCGALEHPTPAVRSAEIPSREEVERLKIRSEELAQKREDALGESSQCLATLDSCRQFFVDALREALPDAILADDDPLFNKQQLPLKNEQCALRAKYQQLKQAIDATENNAKRFRELEKVLIPKQEEAKKAADQALHGLQETLAGNNAQLKTMRAHCEQMRQGLTFASKAETQNAIQECSRRAETIQSDVKQAGLSLQKAQEENSNNESAKVRLTEQLQNKPQHSSEELQRDQKRWLEERQAVDQQRENIIGRIHDNERVQAALADGTGKIEQLSQNLQILEDLCDVASGTVSGAEKQSLEDYVLGYYLDLIIDRANVRYSTMTNGRYRMERRKTASNKQSKFGLDLDVLDSYDGQTRSISSLSGGESFLAALSLALGMSDEIQASAGGIQIEALFVDEGFGSLDREALGVAVNALKKLQEGNRLVGVISHVADLESMIDKKIQVTHAQEKGSMVEIVTG